MFQKLIKIILGEIYPRFFILLNLLQNWFIFIVDICLSLVKFIYTFFVVFLRNLCFIFCIKAVVHNFLYFFNWNFALLLTQKWFFDIYFILFRFLTKTDIQSFALLMFRLFFIQLMVYLLSLVKLCQRSLLVMVDVHIKRLNQISSYMSDALFK